MAHSNVVGERFLDAGEEHNQALMPIEGYEKKPLVSLKEAVIPIQTTLENLDSKVKVALWNARQPLQGLSTDESAAIQLYTMEWPEPHPSLYTLLNQRLRSKKRKTLTPWFSYLKLFLTALYKLPSFKGTIWRGVRGDISDQYNDEYIWWGVSSCTKALSVTDDFISRVGKRTLFNIECINGKVIQAHSYDPAENEIILLPGTYFRVMGKSSPADGLHIIHLLETSPPFETITLPFDISSSSIEPPSLTTLSISTGNTAVTTSDSVTCAKADEPTSILTESEVPQHRNHNLEKFIVDMKDNLILDLGYENLTDRDMKIIAFYLLRNNETLKKLNLNFNQIGYEGAQYLSEELQINTTLKELYLNDNYIGDKGSKYLSKVVEKNTTLTTLHLSGNQISNKGAQYLGEGLKKNKTLTQLYLHDNQIGDEGVEALCKILLKNKTLTILNLRKNPTTSKAEEYLNELQKKNNWLGVFWSNTMP